VTLLAVSISSPTATAMADRMGLAARVGAELVELRLDGLDRPDAETVGMLLGRAAGLNLPVLATCRDAAEGGLHEHPTAVRVAMLCEAIRRGVAFVDCEWVNFRRPEVREPLSAALTRNPACRLILSVHDFEGPLADPGAVVKEIESAQPGAIPKLAYRAGHLSDALAALRLVEEAPGRRIVLCMGPAGQITRLLARRFGAVLTFTALDAESVTAPGQVPLDVMRGVYRWGRLAPMTRLYGVIGDPVAHSMSPAIFNRCFDAAGIDAVYVPLPVTGGREGFDAVMGRIGGWVTDDVPVWGGFSVTIPHKRHALAWLREAGHRVDDAAGRIGAVNTIVIGQDGQVGGYNTDCAGALGALVASMGGGHEVLSGRRAVVVGAGGVARAVVAGLVDAGVAVTVCNRTLSKAEALAAEFGARAAPLEAVVDAAAGADILVNCTSVGMHPDVGSSSVPASVLRPGMLVFDTVYNPIQTRLLREATAAGARCVNGVEMFVRQAAAQYRLWFGAEPDLDLMRQIVTGG